MNWPDSSGVTTGQVARSLSEATYSSRFTTPNYWADPNTGIAYQVQVQYPQPNITSLQDVQNIPVMPGQSQHPLIGDLARVGDGTVMGEYDRRNGFRMLSSLSEHGRAGLGRISKSIDAAISALGTPPPAPACRSGARLRPCTTRSPTSASALLLAILAIFLLLGGELRVFASFFVVLTTAPATVCGVILMLLITHTTLNIESYMGAIMAVGVGTANAILLVTFAEQHRRSGASSLESGIQGAKERMRPILMTSIAMIAGMIPMALAAEVTAPLGRAVIGGLLAATFVNLTVLPFVFSIVQRRAETSSPSLDPDDPESRYATS